MKKKWVKRIGSIAVNVLLYTFLAVCVCSLILSLSIQKNHDEALTLFGHQMRLVTTGSMEKNDRTDVSSYKVKSIRQNSMILLETIPEEEEARAKWLSELQKGDVLTFRYVYTTQMTITHRIVEIVEKPSGGYLITLEGDNRGESEQIQQVIDTSEINSPNYIIGKVKGQLYSLGVLISMLKQPVGIVFLMIVPCSIIILLEVMRIVHFVQLERRKKEKYEQEKKDRELAELKRELEEIRASSNERQKEEKEI